MINLLCSEDNQFLSKTNHIEHFRGKVANARLTKRNELSSETGPGR